MWCDFYHLKVNKVWVGYIYEIRTGLDKSNLFFLPKLKSSVVLYWYIRGTHNNLYK